MERKFDIKKALMITGIILIMITTVIVLKFGIDALVIKNEMLTAEHAITINENVRMYSSAKESKKYNTVSLGSDTYLLKKVTGKDGKDWYKVSVGNKVGYLRAEDVGTYNAEYADKELMVDVSKFNMQNNFKSVGEFKALVVKNNIKFVYIRAGGRGYGQAGNFYTDPYANEYADACEFLNIPFGYYFLDEAINSNEVDEEVKFIASYVDEHQYKNNVLPIAIDVEKHDEEGRADKIWDTRADLINELVAKLGNNNQRAILYSNAKLACQYLTNVNAKMWLAYYPELKDVPDYWLTETNIKGCSFDAINTNKIKGWQFTETGIDSINTKIDISVVHSKDLLYEKIIDIDDFMDELRSKRPLLIGLLNT